MTLLNKSAPVLEVKALDSDGEFEGYASTFGGEPDSHGDVVVAGAFSESLAAHKAAGTMPKLYWQHDPHKVIGKWISAKEDQTGLLVHGKLNMGVQLARETYALLSEKDIDGLSIGYRIKEYRKNEDDDVWFLEKLDLIEISVVSIGANPHARIESVKAARNFQQFTDRLKAGERLTEREFEVWLKGLGFSNSQAERAANACLKGRGDPAEAEKDDVMALLQALRV